MSLVQPGQLAIHILEISSPISLVCEVATGHIVRRDESASSRLKKCYLSSQNNVKMLKKRGVIHKRVIVLNKQNGCSWEMIFMQQMIQKHSVILSQTLFFFVFFWGVYWFFGIPSKLG